MKKMIVLLLFILITGMNLYSQSKINVNAVLEKFLIDNKSIIDSTLGHNLRKYKLKRVEFKGKIGIPHGVKYKENNDYKLNSDGTLDLSSFYKVVVADKASYTNPYKNKEITCNSELEWKLSQSETFTNSASLAVGVGVEVDTPLKSIFGGATLSANVTTTLTAQYEKSIVEENTLKASINIPLDPRTGVDVYLFGAKVDKSLDYTMDIVLTGNAIAYFEKPEETKDWGPIFYDQWWYKGTYYVPFGIQGGPYGNGKFPSIDAHADNRFSSVKLVGPIKVIAYEDKNFKGRSWTYTKDTPAFGVAQENDKISSMIVMRTRPVRYTEVSSPFNVVSVVYEKDRTIAINGTWKGITGREVKIIPAPYSLDVTGSKVSKENDSNITDITQELQRVYSKYPNIKHVNKSEVKQILHGK